MMTLYWAPKTRAFRALWMMEEAGLPYRRELVDIRAGAQATEAYAAINPMRKVPALADGDVHVAESGAICLYVAEKAVGTGLAPAPDDPRRGDFLRWLFFSGGCVEPAFMQKILGIEIGASQAGWGSYDRVIDVLDAALARGPWLLGDHFTAADVQIGGDLHFGTSFGFVEKRPNFVAYLERLYARPAYARATEIDTAGP